MRIAHSIIRRVLVVLSADEVDHDAQNAAWDAYTEQHKACPSGHWITGDNVYRWGPDKRYRSCLRCRRERAAVANAKRAEATRLRRQLAQTA